MSCELQTHEEDLLFIHCAQYYIYLSEETVLEWWDDE